MGSLAPHSINISNVNLNCTRFEYDSSYSPTFYFRTGTASVTIYNNSAYAWTVPSSSPIKVYLITSASELKTSTSGLSWDIVTGQYGTSPSYAFTVTATNGLAAYYSTDSKSAILVYGTVPAYGYTTITITTKTNHGWYVTDGYYPVFGICINYGGKNGKIRGLYSSSIPSSYSNYYYRYGTGTTIQYYAEGPALK